MKTLISIFVVLLLTGCNNKCGNSTLEAATPTISQSRKINECIQAATGNNSDYATFIIDKCRNMVLGVK